MPAIDQIDESLLGTYQIATITYATPQEVLQSTPTVLATTAPTPQVGYTLTTDDFPIFDPAPLSTPTYHAFVIAAGHNPTSGRSINFAGYKNGSATAAVVNITAAADDYWTAIGFFPGVIIGDVLEAKLISHGAGTLWDYAALAIMVDAIQFAPDDQLLGRVNFSLSPHPVLSLGTPTVENTAPFHAQHEGLFEARLGAGAILDALVMTAPSYSGLIHYASYAADTGIGLTGTARPLYVRNTVPFAFLYWGTEITI